MALAAYVTPDVAETDHARRPGSSRSENPCRGRAPNMTNSGFLGSGISLQDGFEQVAHAISDFSHVRGALTVLDAWRGALLEVPAAHEALFQLLQLRDLIANLSASPE